MGDSSKYKTGEENELAGMWESVCVCVWDVLFPDGPPVEVMNYCCFCRESVFFNW